jgi:SAM-dependent methyltransferase
MRLLNKGLSEIEKKIKGPMIDIGCAVGRTSFELAEACDEIVLGIDLNFHMVKLAGSVLKEGQVTYPKRRGGIVFKQREFSVAFERAENVDFWVCDATCLPFGDEAFSLATSLNVLDCVQTPYAHLKELARVLKPDAVGLLSTPYDWNVSATPMESWLGGHSQRSESQGSSEIMLRSLLAGGEHPNAIDALEIVSEAEDLPWTLRLHDRSVMRYLVHMIVVRKNE